MLWGPRQLWWRESEEISGSVWPLFQIMGKGKISVLDTDYSSYMTFCMEGPTHTDEGSGCASVWERGDPEERVGGAVPH